MELECKNCHITLEKKEIELKYNNKCPMCGKINTFEEEYKLDLKRISSDESFIQAMIKLHDEDPIEYELKLQKLKNLKEQEKQLGEKNNKVDNTPKCPHCQSTNIKKISGLNRGMSIVMLGIFSNKINKNFECKKCGYTW